MSLVEVRFRKFWGQLHWNFTLEHLGEDEHGVWLACRPGTPMFKGEGLERYSPGGWVKVVPRQGSWTAIWQRLDEEDDIYVDIVDSILWDGDLVEMVDIDLDLIRKRDGEVAVVDEDEFVEHSTRYDYPDRVVDIARATTARMALALGNHTEPFAEVGPRWQAIAFG